MGYTQRRQSSGGRKITRRLSRGLSSGKLQGPGSTDKSPRAGRGSKDSQC